MFFFDIGTILFPKTTAEAEVQAVYDRLEQMGIYTGRNCRQYDEAELPELLRRVASKEVIQTENLEDMMRGFIAIANSF